MTYEAGELRDWLKENKISDAKVERGFGLKHSILKNIKCSDSELSARRAEALLEALKSLNESQLLNLRYNRDCMIKGVELPEELNMTSNAPTEWRKLYKAFKSGITSNRSPEEYKQDIKNLKFVKTHDKIVVPEDVDKNMRFYRKYKLDPKTKKIRCEFGYKD